MSFLGKVLIVLQVVMSVLFMCGAAAVFSLHSDWRNQALSARQNLQQAETAHTTELQAKNDEITRLTAAMTAEKNRADQQVNQVQQLTAQVAAFRRFGKSAVVHVGCVDASSVKQPAVRAHHRSFGRHFRLDLIDNKMLAVDNRRNRIQPELLAVPQHVLVREDFFRINTRKRKALGCVFFRYSCHFRRVSISNRAINGNKK